MQKSFTDTLIENLKLKNISSNSIKLYTENLKRLNDKAELKNLNFLNDPTKILDKLKDLKENTKKAYLISIITVLKMFENKKKLYDQYYKLLKDIAEKQQKELQDNPNEKTEAQKKNWIEWIDVEKKMNELLEDVKGFETLKTLNHSQYDKLLDAVILGLYVYHPPRRSSDYILMNVVKSYNDKLDKNRNYYSVMDNKFYFNNYKTKKTYHETDKNIDDKLKSLLKLYLKFQPNVKNKILVKMNTPLLVNYEGHEINSNNGMTLILNKIFGKKISTSMLRHIYLSSKYSSVLGEMQNDAKEMAHSTEVAQKIYIKK